MTVRADLSPPGRARAGRGRRAHRGGRPGPAAGKLTAGEVIERMKLQIGGPWRDGGVDGFKAGGPDTIVTGIATTMMATFDAMKAAARQGLNMIITHESTWFSHQDRLSGIEDDPLYRTKLAYTKTHNLVSYHLHDHWHALRPVDGINLGTMQLMGWTKFMHADNQRLFTIPQTTPARAVEGLSRNGWARTPSG